MAFTKLPEQEVMQYQISSRREIVALLRAMQEKNQLVTMVADGGADTVLTSILYVDDKADIVVIDRAPSALINQRILDSDDVSFETVLDNIRVLFRASVVQECLFDDRPALQITVPPTMIRLQRREHYRIATPVANPLRCTIQIPPEDGEGMPVTVVVALKNISGGGIGVMDEKKLINNTIGTTYKNCKLDIPGGPSVIVTLQIRNSLDINLPSGKSVRRIGCMFVDLPRPALASVQRYITKLERERNAKATGMS